jgi:hypothetical protein
MSTATPQAAAPIPWEDRKQLGAPAAFLETIKLFFFAPEEAWSRTKEKGDFGDPMLFGVLVSWIGMFASSLYNLMLPRPWLRFFPGEFRRRFPQFFAVHAGATACSIVIAPLLIVLGLFLGAAVLHVCLFLVGGLRDSTSGFEGTFRTVSYSSVSGLAYVVPFVGWLIALLWAFYLNVKGAVRMHRTTTGRAVFALVIPGLVLIALLLVAVVVLVAVLSHERHTYSL